ncbi:MAG: transcriptional repressor [Alphaproteobacteria bacterium]|nr:transcriptional repressor [Alphaproteobacteria bacterium]
MPRTPTAAGPTAYRSHDHDHCVADPLARAEAVCAAQGARLTPLRRRVLEIVWASHRPMGAYAVLDALAVGGEGRTAPPTVYRALKFLLEHRLVHRIENLNAYIGCPDPASRHGPLFLICRDCGNTAELQNGAIGAALAVDAERVGFSVDRLTVEASGQCSACRAVEAMP